MLLVITKRDIYMATKKKVTTSKRRSKNPVWIRFMCPVIPQTATSLLKCVDQAVSIGCDEINLMISSNGGSVFHGISIHNYLKGLNIPVVTYNFGTSDSIATVLFCAGDSRVCVPHARFLIHPVTMQLNGQVGLKDKDLEEFMKSVNIDTENIARIISDTTGKSLAEVTSDMHNRTTLNPSQAKQYGGKGLATEIKKDLYTAGHMYAVYETGEVFSYIPTPSATASTTFAPVNMYNLPSDLNGFEKVI